MIIIILIIIIIISEYIIKITTIMKLGVSIKSEHTQQIMTACKTSVITSLLD